ncbi:MAG TPA: divalent-cation tolerance protein CutA [Candidatus Deferrimicrobium sp.]|nr:divalent-cation tolerance protein CutA [Candidatus Deferrimicrobium sp.]
METIRVVFVSIPRDEARTLARGLVENRLAACVNVVPRIESWFWWDDKIEHDDEALLIIKTTQQRFDDLRAWVLENHPYDLPEIIALPLSEGLSDYIEWVKKETEQG